MDQDVLKKYITGEATLAEKEEIMEWVKADSRNMQELRAVRRLYDISLWLRKEEKAVLLPSKNRKLLFYGIVSAVSVFLLLLSISYFVFSPKANPQPTIMQTIRVPAGQRVELTLTDGTRIWLNAGTTFSFPNIFSPDKREVLLDGEGYFDVGKKPEQPFIVKTPSYDIKVLGTQFNVLAYGKSPLFEVALLKGSVEILSDTRNERIYLESHTQAYKMGDKLLKGQIMNYDYLLWKDGLICFDDEPVDKMINKLELYYDTKIIVSNEAFKTRKYTGKFRTKDGIEHIIRVFQLKHKFTYEKDDQLNVITIK